MKKLFLIIILMIPLNIYANIVCNDGTISRSCSNCHKGCCSGHGGCTNGYNYNNGYNNSSNYSNNNSSNSGSSNNGIQNNDNSINENTKESESKAFWLILLAIIFYSILKTKS